ncbi:alpha-tocopherol transfer protein-like [Haematobia irritans]|uniref:alpha-tocopherol transfer protein-like n=1 Tax=Haematobia irritans TaxID=7368 RepID=UPI003F4FA8FD
MFCNQFIRITLALKMANIKPLSADLQKIVIEELGEVPSRVPEDLAALRDWLKLQPHLKVRDEDQFLIQFLRGCKYSLERAKQKIDLFYSLKSKYPEMMNVTNVDDPKFREVCRLGCSLVMPRSLNQTGPTITVFRFNFPTNKFTIDDVFQSTVAIHEIMMMEDPYASIHGIVYIIDYALATAGHYMQMSPSFCKKLISVLEKSMPLRIKKVYYINASVAAQQFFKIIIPFCSQKLQQRIHIMGDNLDELRNELSPKNLPKDYGGELPSMDKITSDYQSTWDRYREYFQENANYGSNETLRPGKPLDIDGLFGVGGSFRKLIVD